MRYADREARTSPTMCERPLAALAALDLFVQRVHRSNAYKALKPGGRLLIHDFMVNDSLDSPALGALWALQHVTVNADGLGLCPKEVIDRMEAAGFSDASSQEMIHGMTKLIVAHKK